MLQFDDHIFQRGWFNHQPDMFLSGLSFLNVNIGILQPNNQTFHTPSFWWKTGQVVQTSQTTTIWMYKTLVNHGIFTYIYHINWWSPDFLNHQPHQPSWPGTRILSVLRGQVCACVPYPSSWIWMRAMVARCGQNSLCVEVGGVKCFDFFGGFFFILLMVTHLKINMEHVLMEVWKMIFLYKWVICRFQVPCSSSGV